jgi:hypothetical protein
LQIIYQHNYDSMEKEIWEDELNENNIKDSQYKNSPCFPLKLMTLSRTIAWNSTSLNHEIFSVHQQDFTWTPSTFRVHDALSYVDSWKCKLALFIKFRKVLVINFSNIFNFFLNFWLTTKHIDETQYDMKHVCSIHWPNSALLYHLVIILHSGKLYCFKFYMWERTSDIVFPWVSCFS